MDKIHTPSVGFHGSPARSPWSAISLPLLYLIRFSLVIRPDTRLLLPCVALKRSTRMVFLSDWQFQAVASVEMQRETKMLAALSTISGSESRYESLMV